MDLVDGLADCLGRLQNLLRTRNSVGGKDLVSEKHLIALADQVSAKALHVRNVIHKNVELSKASTKKKRPRIEEEILDKGSAELLRPSRKPRAAEEVLIEGSSKLAKIEDEVLDVRDGGNDEIIPGILLCTQERPSVESRASAGYTGNVCEKKLLAQVESKTKKIKRTHEDESEEEILDGGHANDIVDSNTGRAKLRKRAQVDTREFVTINKHATAQLIHTTMNQVEKGVIGQDDDSTVLSVEEDTNGTYERLRSGSKGLLLKLRHKRRNENGNVVAMDEMFSRGLLTSKQKRKKLGLEKTVKPYLAALQVLGVKMLSKKYRNGPSCGRRRKAFEDDLKAVMRENGRVYRDRIMNNKAVNLHGLLREVLLHGGAQQVFKDCKLLREVYLRSGNHAPKVQIARLKSIYYSSLYLYECLLVHGKMISLEV